jgi:hypothetical protein
MMYPEEESGSRTMWLVCVKYCNRPIKCHWGDFLQLPVSCWFIMWLCHWDTLLYSSSLFYLTHIGSHSAGRPHVRQSIGVYGTDLDVCMLAWRFCLICTLWTEQFRTDRHYLTQDNCSRRAFKLDRACQQLGNIDDVNLLKRSGNFTHDEV